jgi:hypothetical protein
VPALRSVYDRVEEIPEALRGYYVEKIIRNADGKERTLLALNIDRLEQHPDAKNLHAALSRAKQERDVLKKQTRSLLAGDGLRKHLIDAGCDPRLAPMAIAMIERQLRSSEDASGRLVLTGPGGTSLKEMVRLFMDTENGQVCKRPASEQDNAGSRDADKGDGGARIPSHVAENNPWSKRCWNATAQARIFRADRAQADALARQAGHSQAAGARWMDAT